MMPKDIFGTAMVLWFEVASWTVGDYKLNYTDCFDGRRF